MAAGLRSLYEMLFSAWASFEKRAEGYVPFTPLNLLYRGLDKQGKSLLDVGCGRGWPMAFINKDKKFFTVGLDIYDSFLRGCVESDRRPHDEYVLGDARNLPFRTRSFDLVVCARVLEHLDREESIQVLREMERVARRQVAIITPIGEFKRTPATFGQATFGNPYYTHRSTWFPAQLGELGYKVRACGLRGMSGESGFMARLPRFLWPLWRLLWVLAGPLVYFFQRWGGSMACFKRLGT